MNGFHYSVEHTISRSTKDIEAGSVDSNIAQVEQRHIQFKVTPYKKEDHWNVDELALFV